jgi:hypothetical protein
LAGLELPVDRRPSISDRAIVIAAKSVRSTHD